MTFGLIAAALVFISLALLLLGKGAEDQSRKLAESRLDVALSKSRDPLALEKDPLRKKYMPQWVTDNLTSAGLSIDRALGIRFGLILFVILIEVLWRYLLACFAMNRFLKQNNFRRAHCRILGYHFQLVFSIMNDR